MSMDSLFSFCPLLLCAFAICVTSRCRTTDEWENEECWIALRLIISLSDLQLETMSGAPNFNFWFWHQLIFKKIKITIKQHWKTIFLIGTYSWFASEEDEARWNTCQLWSHQPRSFYGIFAQGCWTCRYYTFLNPRCSSFRGLCSCKEVLAHFIVFGYGLGHQEDLIYLHSINRSSHRKGMANEFDIVEAREFSSNLTIPWVVLQVLLWDFFFPIPAIKSEVAAHLAHNHA